MSKIFSSKLPLIKGTRVLSFLFLAVSAFIAGLVIWGANIYYDIDTQKIVVEETQRVTGVLEAAGGLSVTGNATTTGNLYVQGNTYLGNESSDNVYFNARISSHLLPSQDRTYDLGASNLYWRRLYVDTLYATTSIVSGTTTQTGNIVMGDDTWIGLGANSGRIFFDDQTTDFITVRDAYFGIGTTTPSAQLAVTGNVMIDGNLEFVGNRTLEGSGTLTINPTGNLYLQTTGNYIDESGNFVLQGTLTATKVISPELEYSGDIRIDANSAGATTITITNEGTGVANLSVEGDIIVSGGKITLATGETIDAETTDQIIINSDGLTIIKSGGSEILRVSSDGIKITGQTTSTDTLYVTSGGAKITGSVMITSGNLTVQGNITPSTNATYTLGDATTFWKNIYVATTTIGSPSSYLTIDLDEITAPGAFTISSGNNLNITLDSAGSIILSPASGSNVEVQLGGGGLFKVGSAGQFYIDASGNATTSGTIYAQRYFETGGGATIRKSGEQIVRGVVSVFGFDLPARCSSSCTNSFVTLTRVIENDPFPPPYSGTVRKYKFSIRYADTTTTASTIWQVATSSDTSYVDQFTVPPSESTDLSKGNVYITPEVTLPDMSQYDWFLRVKLGGSGGYTLQVYEILLIALDEVQ